MANQGIVSSAAIHRVGAAAIEQVVTIQPV
jgi:hypothetical protein